MKKIRLNYLTFPRFQLPLIALNLCVVVGVCSLFIYKMWTVFAELKKLGEQAQFAPDHPYFKLIDYSYVYLKGELVATFIIAVLLSTLITVYTSHKLAGPLNRLKKYFISMSENPHDLKNLEFRKGDYIEDLGPIVQSAIAKIRADKITEGLNHE